MITKTGLDQCQEVYIVIWKVSEFCGGGYAHVYSYKQETGEYVQVSKMYIRIREVVFVKGDKVMFCAEINNGNGAVYYCMLNQWCLSEIDNGKRYYDIDIEENSLSRKNAEITKDAEKLSEDVMMELASYALSMKLQQFLYGESMAGEECTISMFSVPVNTDMSMLPKRFEKKADLVNEIERIEWEYSTTRWE